MTLKPFAIGTKPYYNIDPVSKGATVLDSVIDGYIDEAGSFRRRGGLKPWLDLETGAPGNGLFAWYQMDRLVAVSGGRVWLIARDGSKVEVEGAVMSGGNIVFADGNTVDGGQWLYLTDGGYPVYTQGADLTRLTATSGAPANVSHCCWHSGRFLINSVGTRRAYATDVNPATGEFDNAYFAAADNPLTAVQRPDNLDYLGTSWEEILFWGKQGLEIWQPDSNFFSPVSGAFSPAGILAPYSVVEADNTVFALCLVDGGNKRAVVKMVGRSPQVISLPIERVLNGHDVVEDAIAWLTRDSEYVITFPTAGETWCYDYRNDAWYQWSKWDSNTASRQEFLGRHSATMWGKTFMQSRADGKIFEYDRATFTDDGQTINTEPITGNFGNGAGVRINKLRLFLKCGASNGVNEPVLRVRWRDNGRQEWHGHRDVLLGAQGEYEFFRDLTQLGSTVTRQFSFPFTDDAELVLARVEMDAESLTR
jgi:hypothetical protein